MPKRNLKLLSFILLPITLIIIPAITMIVSLIYFIPYFACVSFCGCPLQPWREIKEILEKVWTRSTRDINKYVETNEHGSGSSVDPLVISATIFLWMWKPIKLQYEFCFDSASDKRQRHCLCYFGFSFILIPLNIVYAGIFASIQAIIAVLFALIGLTLTVIFTMIGIVPAIILTIGITGVTIITLPLNIYYHALVTYR